MNSRIEPGESIARTFPAQRERITEMLDFLRKAARTLGAPESFMMRLSLVADEAIVNVCSYAFRRRDDVGTPGAPEDDQPDDQPDEQPDDHADSRTDDFGAGRSRGTTRGAIALSLKRIDAGLLELVVADDGMPFDPLKIAPPNRDVPIPRRTPGGLGVFFIRRFASDVFYRYRDNRNILTVRFSLSEPMETPPSSCTLLNERH